MVQVSRYEDAAQAFLKAHPVDTIVTIEKLMTWASDYKNGLAGDLLISDPGKKFNALRRHLNDGGASRNLNEEERFYLGVVDAKRKSCIVRRLSDHVSEQANIALDKSVKGAISPIRSAQKAIDDIKLDELPEEQRQELERQTQDLIELAVPVRKLYSDQIVGHWKQQLVAKGFTEDAAINLISTAPTMMRLTKLLQYTR